MHSSTDSPEELLRRLAEYRELIEEFVISRKDFGTTPAPDEATKLHLRDAFESFWRAHCASQSGHLSAERWESLRTTMRTVVRTEMYRAYWKKHRDEFPMDFQDLVDALTT